MTPSEQAAAAQRAASDPAVSAFVAASAGSGKTKLLIDRLLRLLLAGADPGKILCLTFTKAAAAEMALRLQKRLGDWVAADDAVLAGDLRMLGVAPEAAVAGHARSLFARVLDQPGGMRIETIHAFCQSLLRRFPLEAQLAPHFQVLEEADSHAALQAAREEAMEAADPAALAATAGLVSDSAFGKLVADLRTKDGLGELLSLPPAGRRARLRQALGVSSADEAALLRGAVQWDEAALHDAVLRLGKLGTAKERERADQLFGWLNLPPEHRVAGWSGWAEAFLTQKEEPRAICGSNATKGSDLPAIFAAESARIAAVEDERRALRVAAATEALLTLAAPVLGGFKRWKSISGRLDFDDLIARSGGLLVDPGSAWVLFKLDGGLDHVLLDEVQDTSAAQWQIAGALTAEFFAGESARPGARTVFAVGDRKQSIYSFQGADAAGFDTWRGRMAQQVRQAGAGFRDEKLDVSFRSAPAVLKLVDAVFADPAAARGVVQEGQTLQHRPHRERAPGRVELWPLAPAPDLPNLEPWAVADSNHGLQTAPQLLADALAGWIAAEVGRGAVAPGDVMVLVRRRNDFASGLVRRLKALGVPVAGLDRLYLTDQSAVQDLLALCDVLLLPEDDLSLACVLTSPLGGLADESLEALALGRTGSLWAALQARAGERPEWARMRGLIAALLARADYITPHALLVEILGPHGGRARLLGRLGPEAAEPIDELLGAALTFGRTHPPSLQGFLHWLRRSGAEVKRQAEESGHAVRVMTVHGAKGLQSRLVILPDTTAMPPEDGTLHWAEPGLPLWSPRKELRCRAVEALRARDKAARIEEYNRLLYVALTRAEDRVVVCGWETRKPRNTEETWYAAVRRAMERLGAVAAPMHDGTWPGQLLVHESFQSETASAAPAATPIPPPPPPDWAGTPPGWAARPLAAEPLRPAPLAPSRPDDAALGPVPAAASPMAGAGGAAERGTLIHLLLQHVPALPETVWDSAVAAHLQRCGADPAIADEVAAILRHPALAPLFGPAGRAEQPVTGYIGGSVLTGIVDRVAVLDGAVLLADFKTGREPPATPESTPVLYLRQMAAYRAVLGAIFPRKAIRCFLVWTRAASVQELPGPLLDTHAPRALDAASAPAQLALL